MKRKPVTSPADVVLSSPVDLITSEQAAQLLNLGVISLKRRVWRGEIKCIRLSKSCVRFERSEILRYIASLRS